MEPTTLRRADVRDAAILAALARETFHQTFVEGFANPYPAQDLAAFLEATYAPAVFAEKLADPLQASWILERGGAPLAYANAGPCTLPHPDARPGQGELKRLYVSRAVQGEGLGRRLLDMALAWIEAEHTGPTWLGVWSGNLKAQRLYVGYGFRKVGEYQFPVGGWRDVDFIFARG